MAEKNIPETDTQSDISKSQSQQQPPNQASQQQETGEQDNQQFGEAEQFDSEQPDQGQQGDTLAEKRTDVEGASFAKEKGEAESGFVGAEGEQDTSSELIEDEEFDEGGEGAP